MSFKHTIKNIQKFIKLESSGGIVLFVAAMLAIIISNSPYQHFYIELTEMPITVGLGKLILSHELIEWVNDGLMAIFFFLVTLEIKRELIEGELNSFKKLALPGIAAIGGMLLPAVIYIYFNWGNLKNLQGWAIPTATDIAFALGVLSLLGSRIPAALKVFLTALAILDDLGAIIIIAIFYTYSLSYLSLALAGICLMILFILNMTGVRSFIPFALIGFILWICVLKSGVHATLAGVAVATAIPLRNNKDPKHSLLRELEHALHPWVAFAVLPIFAFLNAGVSFTGVSWHTAMNPITLGIMGGLFLGKQLGVFAAAWFAVKCGFAQLPQGVNWRWIYGVALVCGIGFTMSLFIGTLAFSQQAEYALNVKLGVFVGSIFSGLVGYLFLLALSRSKGR